MEHDAPPERSRSFSCDGFRGLLRRRGELQQQAVWAQHHGHAPAVSQSRGLDLRAIQLLLGRADLKMTQRYLNLTDEALRKTMQQKFWSHNGVLDRQPINQGLLQSVRVVGEYRGKQAPFTQ